MNTDKTTGNETECATIDNWEQPTKVEAQDIAFGGLMEILLPPYDSIPEEFRRERSPWCRIVSRWFFSGLPQGTVFTPKPGIDLETAKRHLSAILRSWAPKHEHKEAGVAWRENVHEALAYLDLQNVNGGNYAVVAVRKAPNAEVRHGAKDADLD